MALAAALLLLFAGPDVGEPSRNATADVLAEQGLVLGIDFDWEDPRAPHPSAERRKAYDGAGLGAWVTAQTESETGDIAEPPTALREYVAENRTPVWRAIAALEKASPDWASEAKLPRPELLPNIRLQRLLLAVALLEVLDGNAIEAERALEASWSLGLPVAQDETLMAQLMRIHDARWQAGVLRKMPGSPLVWLGRLGGDDLWRGMIGAVLGEAELLAPAEGGPAVDAVTEVFRKAAAGVAAGLRNVAPCAVDELSDEAVGKLAERELGAETDPVRRNARDFYSTNSLPNMAAMVRRAARASVDRELTLRILELRLDKEGSRDGKWPAELGNTQSAICPGTSYSYRSDGESMEIRFEGGAAVPDGPVLPLVFRSGPSSKPVGPAPAPALTPAPAGGMISRP